MLKMGLLLLLAVSVLGTISSAFAAPFAYYIVLDAGSSGTRVHVYNFVGLARVPLMDIETSQRQTMKQKPGLSHIAHMEPALVGTAISEHIGELLSFARKCIPEADWPMTPIILKATAGLRAVPQEARLRVMASVRDSLRTSGFLFQNAWAAVIPGLEEGGLAWVTVNFLSGALDGRSGSGGGVQTKGVIEMGGGSTQVSFAVNEEGAFEALAPEVQFRFEDLQGHPHNVFALSYNGYGQEYAQKRLQDNLHTATGIATGAGLSVLEDPCYRKDFRRPPTDDQKALGVTAWVGTGDTERCRRVIRELLFEEQAGGSDGIIVPGGRARNAAGEILESPLSGPFVATENFYYTRDDNKLYPRPTLDLSDAYVSELGRRFCLDGDQEHDPDNKYCFSVAFQSEFLSRIGATGPHTPEITRTIGGADLDWAVGAAVAHFVDNIELLRSLHDKTWLDNTDFAREGLPKSAWGESSGEMRLMVVVFGIGIVLAAYQYVTKTKATRQKRVRNPYRAVGVTKDKV